MKYYQPLEQQTILWSIFYHILIPLKCRSHHGVTARLFVVGVVQAISAIAYAVLHNILITVMSSLRPDSRHVHHLAQVNDQLLVKVTFVGAPGVTTFFVHKIITIKTCLNM